MSNSVFREAKKKMSSNLGNGSKRKNQSIIHSIEKPIIAQNAGNAQPPVLTQPTPQEVQVQPKPEAEVSLKKEEVKVAPAIQKSPPVKEVSCELSRVTIYFSNRKK